MRISGAIGNAVKGTVERLQDHMAVRADLLQKQQFGNVLTLNNWIEKDIDELKVAVMGYAFQTLDWFNEKGRKS